MASKSSDWRPGPTVCRCCLAEGCYKDISTEYFWMGKREVYAEMLLDALNLSIAYSQSGGPNSNSRLICELCITRLREASEFKRQVQECEKTFMQCLDPGAPNMTELDVTLENIDNSEVKVERVKLEKPVSDDDDFDDRPDFGDDDDDDLDDQPLTKFASKEPKKESVDILDLLDNSKAGVKRKSTSKTKTTPAKKVKLKEKPKKETVKPTTSKSKAPKPTIKLEKKKKGPRGQNTNETVIKLEGNDIEKRRYQRSARAEARIIIKKNASAVLACWTVCPFRWQRNRFQCAYCEANFTECFLLREHVRLCSSRHSFKDIYSKYKEMTLINIDITEAICTICSENFVNVNQMQEHVVQHGFDFDPNHPDGVVPFLLDKETWKCVLCLKKFNNFLKLYEHMNVHYQHYICATCGKGYMTAPRLRKHSEVHISGSFPCNECGRVFTMRAARDSHKAHAHAKGPRYGCPHCNLRFEGYYSRMAHLNEAHREKEVKYSCAHCELSFKTSGKRAVHVRSVHFPPQRDFGCPFCEWQFKTAYELKRHMIRHTGERNFHCNVCGKSFPRNRALTTHLKTHEEFPCKWCATIFKQRSQLMSHLRTNHPHLDEVTPDSIKIQL